MTSTALWGGAALAAVTLTAATANAGIPPTVLTVTAQNSNGISSFEVVVGGIESLNSAKVDPLGNLTWDIDQWLEDQNLSSWEMVDPNTGMVIAEINGLSVEYIADPVVTTNFSVQAIGADTRFTITSGPLTFPTLTNPSARATGSITATDFFIDGVIGSAGVSITGEHASGHILSNVYNGGFGSGTLYDEFFLGSDFGVAPGGSQTLTDATPIGGTTFTTISGNVDDISVGFDFTLSAWDLASGNATFEVIPAPGAALVLAAGGLAFRRRLATEDLPPRSW
ncbi:MAG: hypothetical protein AAGB51_10795 [Planctomycetota bacterium]